MFVLARDYSSQVPGVIIASCELVFPKLRHITVVESIMKNLVLYLVRQSEESDGSFNLVVRSIRTFDASIFSMIVSCWLSVSLPFFGARCLYIFAISRYGHMSRVVSIKFRDCRIWCRCCDGGMVMLILIL